jgi:hypothetical protein
MIKNNVHIFLLFSVCLKFNDNDDDFRPSLTPLSFQVSIINWKKKNCCIHFGRSAFEALEFFLKKYFLNILIKFFLGGGEFLIKGGGEFMKI